ncbi:MAG: UvrD-helicase domain-containing protein [Verrucomicrobiota bacterium]
MLQSPADDAGLTPAQRQAVAARGNVLVMAGAGTGKTRTLIARCLDCVCRERASLDELLVVTFTEAAALELRERLRQALDQQARVNPDDSHWAAQLALFDAAHIGTLHGFCLKLAREHFYELGLDPQFAVLDAGEARLLAGEMLEEELQRQYAGNDDLAQAVRQLIQVYGGGRDENIRRLVLQIHNYAQTRPDADGWLARQVGEFSVAEPAQWRAWLLNAIGDWRDEWGPIFEGLAPANVKARELAGILARLPAMASHDAPAQRLSRKLAAGVLEQIVAADANWPAKQKTALRKPLEDFFDEARFLVSLAVMNDGKDPLAEDWDWIRGHMTALLRLTRNFAARFAARKGDDGVADFHDLEQFALKLLWDFSADRPTPIAAHWRGKIRFVFVDEYQDINAAQDKIIQALGREAGGRPALPGEFRPPTMDAHRGHEPPPHTPPGGHPLPLGGEGRGEGAVLAPQFHGQANRFLVGDVKQSIYRFRLADPGIFRKYAATWQGATGQTFPLTENFRSREPLLHLINSVFSLLMREEVGGVDYHAGGELQFGASEPSPKPGPAPDTAPRVELILGWSEGPNGTAADEEPGAGAAELPAAEQEARRLAQRLADLKAARHEIRDRDGRLRPVEWRDMAVLLRAPAGKADAYAREFERAGVPLVVERGGFYDSAEILDLLSLLQLLDNPLQDIPCLAVLRSPIVGLSLDELAAIRLAAKDVHFWTALNRMADAGRGAPDDLPGKIGEWLKRYSRWRKLARQSSLSDGLETILAETHYAEWLRTRPRGARRLANVNQLLNLARRFDQFQRQGLFRFLRFIQAQREAGVEPDVAAATDENAVRLMSIHQSKGLEFPVVAVADLAKPFNQQDLRSEIILDERFGLCPRVKPPHTGRRYPSLSHWLAQRHQRRELWGEELRLFYVAVTRARDTLILSASITHKKWETLWAGPPAVAARDILAANSHADWLGLWFAAQISGSEAQQLTEGELPHLRWRIVGTPMAKSEKPEFETAGEMSAVGRRCRAAKGSQSPEAELETAGGAGAPASRPGIKPADAAGELPELNEATRERLHAMLVWKYPFAAATRQPAKSSVTALRRQAEESDEEAAPLFPRQRTPRPGRRAARLSPAEIGAAHHKFLQFVALEKSGSLTTLAQEARRLESEKILSADERAALDLVAVADFWNSATGKKIREHGALVKRELPFTAGFSQAELAEIQGNPPEAGLENEFVVVQGVADLAVVLPEEIWLVDFKTDDLSAAELPAKVKSYTRQLKLYASALAGIYARPVTHCWLHFLSLRHSERIG